jgi:hypothetical protein
VRNTIITAITPNYLLAVLTRPTADRAATARAARAACATATEGPINLLKRTDDLPAADFTELEAAFGGEGPRNIRTLERLRNVSGAPMSHAVSASRAPIPRTPSSMRPLSATGSLAIWAAAKTCAHTLRPRGCLATSTGFEESKSEGFRMSSTTAQKPPMLRENEDIVEQYADGIAECTFLNGVLHISFWTLRTDCAAEPPKYYRKVTTRLVLPIAGTMELQERITKMLKVLAHLIHGFRLLG